MIEHVVRRTIFGSIMIKYLITEYNKYTGGVDLANTKRLECNSAIMCQNKWWLKLLFYVIDVVTSNALVLHKLAINDKSMNIVDFKLKLLDYLI